MPENEELGHLCVASVVAEHAGREDEAVLDHNGDGYQQPALQSQRRDLGHTVQLRTKCGVEASDEDEEEEEDRE